ncbi:MAG: hypothetical protein SF162_16880 [bacterium]|nr:hypothetical protein [bacterium]
MRPLTGKDLDWTSDAVERIDTNCFALLMGAQLGASPAFERERAAMETVIGAFHDQGGE